MPDLSTSNPSVASRLGLNSFVVCRDAAVQNAVAPSVLQRFFASLPMARFDRRSLSCRRMSSWQAQFIKEFEYVLSPHAALFLPLGTV
jgi:hypothetical protein